MNDHIDRVKIVAPNITSLAQELKLGAGETMELECPRATLLNIGFRIRTTGQMNISVEEYNGEDWKTTGELEVEKGETVWHYILKKNSFRLRLNNPSSSNDVVVSVDVNLPCLKEVDVPSWWIFS